VRVHRIKLAAGISFNFSTAKANHRCRQSIPGGECNSSRFVPERTSSRCALALQQTRNAGVQEHHFLAFSAFLPLRFVGILFGIVHVLQCIFRWPLITSFSGLGSLLILKTMILALYFTQQQHGACNN
jgi:hypothetical protein